ncbi:MAG: ABC transporter permease, partial [Finegoldia sp.]
MKNLIKFNAERLKKDKFFYVLILSVTLLSILSGFQDTVQGNISSGYEGFIKSYSDIFMSFFIAVYCGYFIGSDFSSKIIQRQISSGISRKDIVISKLIVLMIASFIIVNLYPIIVGIMGSLKYGFLPIKDYNNILEIVRIIIISNLCFMSLTSIYSLLGFATQSIGETIGISLAIP